MFNSYNIIVYTFSQKLIDDKIFAKATKPNNFEKIETKSKCPFSKFAKYMPFLNIKHCQGVSSFFNKSILIKSWSDYYANNHNEMSETSSADKNYVVGEHSQEQFNPLFQEKVALKLISPFIIEVPKNLMILASEAVYHYENDRTYKNIKFLQGIIAGTKKTNVIFMLNKEDETFIKYKDPLIYLTPLTDKKFTIEYKLISIDEYKKMYDADLHQVMVADRKENFNG
jgi:hypothetical protein